MTKGGSGGPVLFHFNGSPTEIFAKTPFHRRYGAFHGAFGLAEMRPPGGSERRAGTR
jgi:hypothetical protein